MTSRLSTPLAPRLGLRPLCARLLGAGLLAAGLAQAQSSPAATLGSSTKLDWQACQALKSDPAGQLACFQRWADAQTSPDKPAPALTTAPANAATGQPATQVLLLPTLNTELPDGKPVGCKDSTYSELSKFWELQRGTDCDNFGLRGYRPTTLAVIASSSVNEQPTSDADGHSALNALPYNRTETRIQLSVRTKVAKGLLKRGSQNDDDHDSVWIGYTQQSYWQLFNAGLSRPFRVTDHEPEALYIYPHQIALPGGWSYGCRARGSCTSPTARGCRCHAAGTAFT